LKNIHKEILKKLCSYYKVLYFCPPQIKQLKIRTMYAIVDIAGFQYKVSKDKKLYVSRLKGEEGSDIEFDQVLLIDNEGDVKVGKPTVDGAKVSAKILSHVKDDKKIVFKKKRRKGYQVKKGHRQSLTQIQVENIVA